MHLSIVRTSLERELLSHIFIFKVKSVLIVPSFKSIVCLIMVRELLYHVLML